MARSSSRWQDLGLINIKRERLFDKEKKNRPGINIGIKESHIGQVWPALAVGWWRKSPSEKQNKKWGVSVDNNGRENARAAKRERAHTELNRCVFPSAMVRPGTKTFFFSLLLLKIRHLVSLPFDFVCVLKSWTERKGKDYNHFSPSFFFSSPSSHIWFWRGEKTIALMQLVHIFRTLACNAHEHTCCKCANGGLCRWYNQLSKACVGFFRRCEGH